MAGHATETNKWRGVALLQWLDMQQKLINDVVWPQSDGLSAADARKHAENAN